MNSHSALSLARRSTIAAFLAGAAVLLGACSTASVASAPQKTYSYAELHSMMVKLVQEPAPESAVRPTEAMAASTVGRTLAANP